MWRYHTHESGLDLHVCVCELKTGFDTVSCGAEKHISTVLVESSDDTNKRTVYTTSSGRVQVAARVTGRRGACGAVPRDVWCAVPRFVPGRHSSRRVALDTRRTRG